MPSATQRILAIVERDWDGPAGAERTDAQIAMVEYGRPENGATAYLLRPFFPVVELNGVAGGVAGDVGDVGLGARLTQLPDAYRTSSAAVFLGPVRQPGLVYDDGVRVTEAIASSRWTPGRRIRLALTWTTPTADAFRAVDGVSWECGGL